MSGSEWSGCRRGGPTPSRRATPFCGCSGRRPLSVHHCESGLTLGLVTVRKPPQTPVQPAYAALLSLSPPRLCPDHQSKQTVRFRQYSLTDTDLPIHSARQETTVYDPLTTHNRSTICSCFSPQKRTNKQNQSHRSKCLVVPSSSSKWLSMFTRAINQPPAIKSHGSFFSVPPFSVFYSAQIRLRPYRISSDQAAST